MSLKGPLRGLKGIIEAHLQTAGIALRGLKFEKEEEGCFVYRIIYDLRKGLGDDTLPLYSRAKAGDVLSLLEEHFKNSHISIDPEEIDSIPRRSYWNDWRVKATLWFCGTVDEDENQ